MSRRRRPITLGRRVVAVTDPLVHALLAAAVVAPLAARAGRGVVATAVTAATVIDVDHPLAARSLRLEPMLSLAQRPPTHNLTTALLAATMGTLAGGPLHGWAAFSGLTAHLLYDAGDSSAPTPLLWPWREARQLGWPRSLAGLAALALGSLLVSRVANGQGRLLAAQPTGAFALARISSIDSSVQVAKKSPTTSRTSSSDSAR